MRSKLGKVGMVMLALVFVVGAMGAGFASWTDELVVSGTVTTADFGWKIYQLSEAWVYKDLLTGELIRVEQPIEEPNLLLVAYTDIVGYDPFDASEGIEIDVPDSFEVEYWNMFPSVWFSIDIGLHYVGSIPSHLTIDCEWDGDPLLGDMFSIDAINYDTGEEIDFQSPPFYYQWEFCDRVKFWLEFHLEQLDDLIDKSGTLTCTITTTQWAEVEN